MLSEAIFSVQDIGIMGVIVATLAIYTNRKIARLKNSSDKIPLSFVFGGGENGF